MSPQTRSWHLVRNVLLLLVALSVGLLLAEASVRVLGLADHLVTDPIFEASSLPHVRYHYKPHLRAYASERTEVVTNSLGFRDVEYPGTPPDEGVRLVVLGDSFTFGQGVPFSDVYTEILEHELSQAVAPVHVEVINFGVQGYTVQDEVATYLDIARELRPQIALLAMIADDLNLMRTENFVDRKGYLTKRIGGFRSLKAYMRKSHLLLFAKEVYLKHAYRSSQAYQRATATAEAVRPKLELLDRQLQPFLAACTEDSVIPVVALLDTWAGPATTAIVDHLRATYPDLRIVDCTGALARLPHEQVVTRHSGHPNALGHKIIAQEIEQALLPVVRDVLSDRKP
jgi:lysophospholipase L1-like esterase